MKKAFGISLFTIVFSLTLATGALAANLGAGTVNATAINFRESPSIDSTILATVKGGSEVVVISKYSDDWYKVMVDGVTGYMHSAYIDVVEELDFSIGDGQVTGNGVRFRSEASRSSSTLDFLYTADRIQVLGVDGEWYKVSFEGKTGFVSSDYVKVDEQDLSVTRKLVVETVGMKMAELANQHLGISYVYGGASPSGFDCSGFTYYLFQYFGFKDINRTASSQWANGEAIEKEKLEIGDLVFFSSTYSSSIEHVGLYIGDGQFIHSSSGKGCVTINKLTDWYYQTHYYGAIRVPGTNEEYVEKTSD